MSSLPYSIASVRFPFPALAALAGRTPLGGRREVVLATMQVARLVAGSGNPHFNPSARAERSASTRSWLAAIALPADLRAALFAVVDAAGDGDASRCSATLQKLIDLLETRLDEPSRAELRGLLADPESSAPRAGALTVEVGVVTGVRRAPSGDTAASSAALPRAAG